MKFLVAGLLGAAALATTASADADTDVVGLQRVSEMLGQQAAAFELRLEQQAAAHAQEMAALREAVSASVTSEGSARRFLDAIDLADFAGLSITKSNAGVKLGVDGDVGLLRTGDGEIALVADDVSVTGALYVGDMAVDVKTTMSTLASDTTAVAADVTALEGDVSDLSTTVGLIYNVRPTLFKSRHDWGSSYPAYTAAAVFGNSGTAVFDSPSFGVLGAGRMISGTWTAPVDGVYFMTTVVRLKDSSTGSFEIQFLDAGTDNEGFEMWIPLGDSSGRRCGMSTYLVHMQEGDTLYPKSDIAASTGVLGQTSVFQIAPDRIAFSAKNSGTSTSTKVAFGSIYTEAWSFVLPSTYSTAYSGGIFTAPRDGLYYFTCKLRVSDATTGDSEIEWAKNGATTDGGFEMWLHDGDPGSRRAHMTAFITSLTAGDQVYPFSDTSMSGTKTVIFSGFELPPDLPAFSVASTASFTYTTADSVIGSTATSTTKAFERGSTNAISLGTYTVPMDGFYYFTMKVRTGDADNGDFEIDWRKSGAAASSNAFEMWMHLGDYSSRRAGMTSTLLKCKAGDTVYAVSGKTLPTGDVLAQWTFSGFKVE